MHTFSYRDAETGVSVYIHHNGDYTGEARVEIVRPEGQPDGSVSDVSQGVRIPAKALAEFSFQAARDKFIELAEDLEP